MFPGVPGSGAAGGLLRDVQPHQIGIIAACLDSLQCLYLQDIVSVCSGVLGAGPISFLNPDILAMCGGGPCLIQAFLVLELLEDSLETRIHTKENPPLPMSKAIQVSRCPARVLALFWSTDVKRTR